MYIYFSQMLGQNSKINLKRTQNLVASKEKTSTSSKSNEILFFKKKKIHQVIQMEPLGWIIFRINFPFNRYIIIKYWSWQRALLHSSYIKVYSNIYDYDIFSSFIDAISIRAKGQVLSKRWISRQELSLPT